MLRNKKGFLVVSMLLVWLIASGCLAQSLASDKSEAISARDYLSKKIYTQKEVDSWFAGKTFPFSKHHPEFGWLLPNGRFQDGQDGAISTYTYLGDDGSRIMINHADKPCRINCYGDSFTQCHQVSDGETWEEALAAHIGEPVRNYGIGGWSVYQAYRRMLKEEQDNPAELIILNIYGDDHYRNLDSWRNIRANKHPEHIQATLPYLTVNLETGEVKENENPCPTKESYYNLCDIDWCVKQFKDDFVLNIMLAHANAKAGNPEAAYNKLVQIPTHGLETQVELGETLSAKAKDLHTRAAIMASMKVVDWVEAYAKKNNKKVLYILSFPTRDIIKYVKERKRFDQPFVDYLKQKGVPYICLMDEHIKDFRNSRLKIEDYLKQYYYGHYNPRGNMFCAFALKDKVTDMLAPKPPTYSGLTIKGWSLQIVVPADAGSEIVNGAEKLRTVIEKYGGSVDIVKDTRTRMNSYTITIGTSKDSRLFKKFARLSERETDGFYLLCRKKFSVLIAGTDDKGALLGCEELAKRIQQTDGSFPSDLKYSNKAKTSSK